MPLGARQVFSLKEARGEAPVVWGSLSFASMTPHVEMKLRLHLFPLAAASPLLSLFV
jgi:hypothetical protein